jgi:hypothetical protein
MTALCVGVESFKFDEDEGGPDDDLRIEFEAANRLNYEENAPSKPVIEGLLLAHEARR